ncbi:medium-chain fatty acid-CoA ligase faa2 [Linderina pennispora]|nr:medium-chain fatty acid-CoA ligase faa2 [Linderina pennispora]
MVPNEEFLRREITESKELAHLEGKDLKDICADKAASDYLCRVINSWGRKSDLKGYEIPKNIHLESVPFTIENNLLTPTLKIKRADAKKLYKDILDRLYAELTKN